MAGRFIWYGDKVRAKILNHLEKNLDKAAFALVRYIRGSFGEAGPMPKGWKSKGQRHKAKMRVQKKETREYRQLVKKAKRFARKEAKAERRIMKVSKGEW